MNYFIKLIILVLTDNEIQRKYVSYFVSFFTCIDNLFSKDNKYQVKTSSIIRMCTSDKLQLIPFSS